MSGGYFDYKENYLTDIADSIRQAILKERVPSAENNNYKINLKENILKVFSDTVKELERLAIYVHRIGYLLEGDDGEESFHSRIQEDLLELEKKLFREG